jgi:predicted transcriptional regulator
MELRHELQNVSTNLGIQEMTAGVPAMEKHYTVAEISKLWFFSENTIRRLFTKEPGVIKIARQETRFKRGYTSLRIPERIAQRVHRRLQGIS